MAKSSSPKKDSKNKSPKSKSPKNDSKNKSPKKGSDKSSKKDKSSKVEITQIEMDKAPITHVIFDLDGVILENRYFMDIFIKKLMHPYNIHLPLSVKLKIKDKKLETIAKIIIKEFSIPISNEEFMYCYKKWTPEILKNEELLPGVSRLVMYFQKHHVPMAVITDFSQENYESKKCRHKLIFDKFCHVVCYGSDEEARKNKPDPFIYELAASRFTDNKPNGPYNILVFEDTIDGVDAALTAGMKVVWVPDAITDASLKDFNKNLMVIKNLECFQPELWRMPVFSDLYSV